MKNFHKCKNTEMILKNYGLLVYQRSNQDKRTLIEHNNVEYIKSPMIDISDTFIRKAIKKGHSIKYLMPESVESYIDRKGLYQ